jgi:hypothetical protein
VLKTLPLKLTGYCGLMLAVCEDQVGDDGCHGKAYAQTGCGAL